ncbi:MAG: glycosyltransferase [Nitrospirota bacterium]
MKKRVLIYCQHVLGIGHLVRSLEIVRGLKDWDVTFLNGGDLCPGMEFPPQTEVVNLPPIKSESDFKTIQASENGQGLEAVKRIRASRIQAEFARIKPDVFLIEMFPFGRKHFAYELVPVLEQIRLKKMQTAVVCSLRDILVNNKRNQAQHNERAITLMNRYFDLLLVHSDPRFQTLDETFPQVQELQCDIRYTGFVSQPAPQVLAMPSDLQTSDQPMILVSIGGGRVGFELVECALQASAQLRASFPHRMMILTGPYMPEDQFKLFLTLAAMQEQVTILRYTPDFLSYLREASLSVSMAGYNTCMNLLATGTKALVIPFTGGGNTEQTIRAEKLAQLGAVGVVSPSQLRPDYLAERMIQTLQTPTQTQALSLDQDGAMKTAACLEELVERKKSLSGDMVPVSFSLQNGNHRITWQRELRASLKLIQAEGKEVQIFFRDDDIDEDEKSLVRLLDLFLAHGAPLNLAIIPDLLSDATVRQLLMRDLWIPESLGLIQHGWRHTNHEQEGRKCEFGISRSLADKFNDIARGKSRLEEAFGPRYYPAFTPPWNRCTEDTFGVLDELGFVVFSKDQGKEPVEGHRFQEISTTLDLYRWKDGATLKPADEIVPALISQMRELDRVGILLHHKVMDDTAFTFLDQLLDELRQFPVVRFHTLKTLMQQVETAQSVSWSET